MSAGGHVAIQDIERISGVSRLEQWSGAGGTSLRLRTILDSGLVAAGAWVVIAPYTAQCEVRAISSYENRDLTVAALTYAHDPDTAVLITTVLEVNVAWWGDSGTALNDAIAAGKSLSAPVYAPAGTYEHAGTIALTNLPVLRGDGPQRTIFEITPTAGQPLMTATPSGAQLRSAVYRGFQIKGAASSYAAGEHGLFVGGANSLVECVFDDILIDQAGADGLHLSQSVYGCYFRVHARNCKRWGVYIDDSQTYLNNANQIEPTVIDCASGIHMGSSYANLLLKPWIEDISGVGTGRALELDPSSGTVHSPLIIEPYIEWGLACTGTEAVYIDDTNTAKIVGGQITAVTKSGVTITRIVEVDTGCDGVYFDSVRFSTNIASLASGVRLDAGSNIIWNCRFVVYGSGSYTENVDDNTGQAMLWGTTTRPYFEGALYMAGTNLLFGKNTTGGNTLLKIYTDANKAYIQFGSPLDTNLYRYAANQLKTDDMMIAGGGFGAGNFENGAAVGTHKGRMEVFNAAGASIGYLEVFNAP